MKLFKKFTLTAWQAVGVAAQQRRHHHDSPCLQPARTHAAPDPRRAGAPGLCGLPDQSQEDLRASVQERKVRQVLDGDFVS